MNVYNVSRFLRLKQLFATTALLLSIAGCGGGATISSPFTVEQTSAETRQEDTAATAAESAPAPVVPVPVVPAPAVPVPAPPAPEPEPENNPLTDQQNPAQNDPPVEAGVTVSAEPPQQQAITNPTPADITDLVLVTGQSNALGADTTFDPALDGQDPRTFAYTDSGWQVADLHQIWDQGWFPRGDAETGPSNNLSLHFGKRVTSMDTSRVVGFILVTAPGQPISHWHPDGDFFNSIRNKVSRAINELPSKSRIDGLLWHQGESDGEDDPAYGAALYALIDAFRSESWYGTDQPFICAETAALPVNRQLNRLNSDNDPSTACVAAEGLGTRGDDAHFDAAALRTIGQRYADQYLQMTR